MTVPPIKPRRRSNFLAGSPRWKTRIRFAAPRIAIETAAKNRETDLRVLGTQGYSGVAHMVPGTCAGDVLREVPRDGFFQPRPAATEYT